MGVGVNVAVGKGVGVGGMGVGVGGTGVGVSGMISLVAARQANVEKRSAIEMMMSFRLSIELSAGDDDPTGIQKIKIEVTKEHDDPQGKLDTVEQVFP